MDLVERDLIAMIRSCNCRITGVRLHFVYHLREPLTNQFLRVNGQEPLKLPCPSLMNGSDTVSLPRTYIICNVPGFTRGNGRVEGGKTFLLQICDPEKVNFNCCDTFQDRAKN